MISIWDPAVHFCPLWTTWFSDLIPNSPTQSCGNHCIHIEGYWVYDMGALNTMQVFVCTDVLSLFTGKKLLLTPLFWWWYMSWRWLNLLGKDIFKKMSSCVFLTTMTWMTEYLNRHLDIFNIRISTVLKYSGLRWPESEKDTVLLHLIENIVSNNYSKFGLVFFLHLKRIQR